MKTKSLLVIALLATVLSMNGQTKENPFSMGLNVGKNEYNGELGNGIFNFNKPTYLFGGLTLTTYLNHSFEIGIDGNYGRYGYKKDEATRFQGDKYDAYMFLNYKLNNGYLFSKESKISPFLMAGIGLAGYQLTDNINNKIKNSPTDLIIPLGAGLKFYLSEKIAIQYKFVYGITNYDKHDNLELNKQNDVFVENILSLVFSIGGEKDSDKDGIADKYDKCDNTPPNINVNILGCPVDTDNDGLADYLDNCPKESGLAKFNGCPDTDNDGVMDSEDLCTNTPTKVKVDSTGCPIDSDNDGVADYLDKCPKEKGLEKFNGCPDTDNDGIADNDDKCPKEKGSAKLNGCPDRDNDGVPDNMDKCPDVAGLIVNKGCPEVKSSTLKIFNQALQGIQFESGKDIIKKTSNSILDQLVKVMKENPSYNLEINGHTDDAGDDAFNMELSEKRANAVRKYLNNKGINATKLTAKGHGETAPVTDNKTAEGKAKNRRVEFKVIF